MVFKLLELFEGLNKMSLLIFMNLIAVTQALLRQKFLSSFSDHLFPSFKGKHVCSYVGPLPDSKVKGRYSKILKSFSLEARVLISTDVEALMGAGRIQFLQMFLKLVETH